MKSPLQSNSAEDTYQYAYDLGQSLSSPALITLSGDLGAGKTLFIRGLAAGAAGVDDRNVTSPTFTYLHIYPGRVPIYHFDLYRLTSSDQFLQAGFSDYLNDTGICCIEWAERIEPFLHAQSPTHWLKVHIEYITATTRQITLSSP